MPDPFNQVSDLMGFTSFRQGKGGPADTGDILSQSIQDAEFAKSQFETALQFARNEIYLRTDKTENADWEDYQADILKEVELWWATARLYPKFGERIALKKLDADIASQGDSMRGADAPSPYEKMERWFSIAEKCREKGMELLNLVFPQKPFDIKVGTLARGHCSCLGRAAYLYPYGHGHWGA